MDNLISITLCDDGSCCCLPPRTTMALISIMSLFASAIDGFSAQVSASCPLRDCVESMRSVLLALFQLANLLLLLASVVENALLVNIYVCYTLGFVVMALLVSVLELLCRVRQDAAAGVVTFVPEVIFIFVISRCLPLVNTYRTHLEQLSATLTENVQNQ